jgi:hypothetical protein
LSSKEEGISKTRPSLKKMAMLPRLNTTGCPWIRRTTSAKSSHSDLPVNYIRIAYRARPMSLSAPMPGWPMCRIAVVQV